MNQKIIPLLLAAIGSSAAAAPTVEAPNYGYVQSKVGILNLRQT